MDITTYFVERLYVSLVYEETRQSNAGTWVRNRITGYRHGGNDLTSRVAIRINLNMQLYLSDKQEGPPVNKGDKLATLQASRLQNKF